MAAKLIYRRRHTFPEGNIIEVVIWQVPTPVRGSQHYYKYRLFYGGKQSGRIVGYDNERPKGDHRHYGEQEEPYTFVSVEKLLEDFLNDVAMRRDDI